MTPGSRVPTVLRLWRRGRVTAEVDDEFAFHLDMRARELIATGLTPEEARGAALRQFGDLKDATTYCRRTGERRERRIMRTEWFLGLGQDLRFALRTLIRAPGFTLAAVLTLALGIGASTAIFSVVRGILLRPYPYPEPGRLVVVAGGRPGQPLYGAVSPANAFDWRSQNHSFSGMAVLSNRGAVLTRNGDAQMVLRSLVSADYFAVLGARPLLGRLVFNEAEAAWQGSKAVVLSEGFWRSQFGGDPHITDSTVTLDNVRYRVIGVVSDAQAWPRTIVAWTTFSIDPAQLQNSRGGVFLSVMARLKPGATMAGAQSDMDVITRRLLEQYPQANAGGAEYATVVSLRDWVTGSLRTPLLVLLASVGFVLLIACVNVANLLLVRGVGRATELAVRTSLGAGAWRLVRQLVTESLVLAAAGGLVATGLAVLAVKLLVHAAPQNIPSLDTVRVDGLVLLLTLGVVVVVGLVFGLIPARQLVRRDVAGVLRAGGRGTGTGGVGAIGRRLLVGAEVALSVMLLTGAGLMIRSFTRLMSVDPGFRTAHAIHFSVSMPAAKYPTQDVRAQFVDQLLERMRAIPGVQVAGGSLGMPLTQFGFMLTFTVNGRPPVPPAQQPAAQIRWATPDYFRAMGITMKEGRSFTPADRMGAPKVVLISEAAARQFFPGEQPIGKHVNLGMTDGDNTLEGDVVGVVHDVKQASLAQPAAPQFWIPVAQFPMSAVDVVLRTSGDPTSAIADARRDLRALDAGLAMSQIHTLDEMVATSVAQPRFYMTLLAAFAVVALVLSAIGIYGVIAYLVGQRSREIGIRMALGALPATVVRMMLREGAAMIATGLVIGLAGALALTRLMHALLFDTSTTDPLTYVAVIATLAGVALLASGVPALRAAQVDPALTMRAE